MTHFTPVPGKARHINERLRNWACSTDDDARLGRVTTGDIARQRKNALRRWKGCHQQVHTDPDDLTLCRWWSRKVYDAMEAGEFCPAETVKLMSFPYPMPTMCIISDICDAWKKTLA